ncbi:MAG: TIM barrel protein [Candidatus Omnitrophica bacterium]|nr:TIM barrel protein [Candidatus Omnitrophota bacterium]
MEKGYRFSFGPWNIHTGADPFGPPVREEFSFDEKLDIAVNLKFDAIQFHDDDIVDINPSASEIGKKVKEIKKKLDDRNLAAEFVAPRIWEHPLTVDGTFTSNNPEARKYAIERTKKAIDIANLIGTKNLVLWPAREGSYTREAKDAKLAIDRFVEYLNSILDYDKNIRILGEMKPNEPMDASFCPTTGHFLALASRTIDSERVGVLIETAHTILAGLEPSDEMGFALSFGKLWGIHLNDQNGLKFDEDRTFGVVNPKRALSQVYLLEKYKYGKNGEYVGLDVKVLRTQKKEVSYKHLQYSRQIFLALVDIVRTLDENKLEQLRASQDYEEIDYYITNKIFGR